MGRIEYNAINSGGSWWLTDEDWHALEAAGWKVEWRKFLGSIATQATREGLSLEDAVAEWEKVTGKCSTDAGCPCCGVPHSFTEYNDANQYVRSGPKSSYSASW